MPEFRMPSTLTEDMRGTVHRARLRYERKIAWSAALPAEEIDAEVARRVACPVQRGFDEQAYQALLTCGVQIDE